jgi:predicted amidohydrolase
VDEMTTSSSALDDDGARDGTAVFAALELPARFAAVDAQLERVSGALRALPEVALCLLPEAALTGYVSPTLDFDIGDFGEPAEGATFDRVRALAADLGSAIVYPFVEVDGDDRFNTICGVDVDGSVLFRYRKRHPWYPETWATPGAEPLPRFVFRGLNVTAAICFDIHFVRDEDEATLRWADVLLFPSAWVDEEGDGRAPILRSLADALDLSVVNANWGPGVPSVGGQGGSRIVVPGRAPRYVDAPLGIVTMPLSSRRSAGATPPGR